MKKIVTLAALIAVTACAPAPESIQAAYVSDLPYRGYSCDQLGEEAIRLNQALSTASVAQSSARTNDAVGIILIGLPVGSMSGQSIAPQIALYKGQIEAVRTASLRNNCPEMTRIHPSVPPGTPPVVQPQPAAQSQPVSTSERR